MSPSKKENSLVLAFYLDIRYLISFHKQCNRVLEGDIKKEPYRYRILDTRFYIISCIQNNKFYWIFSISINALTSSGFPGSIRTSYA